MSSEWTIVTGNKRNVNVVVEQKSEVRPTREENFQKENNKRHQWEQRRQKKIDEYNMEFPLLPGSKDLVSDAQKIDYIETKRATKKEADQKAYLEREARRQAKAKRNTEIAHAKAKREEEEHVKTMIEKWGAHRWYRKVAYTEDDCDTAHDIREEEDEREWRLEEIERQQEDEEEKREEICKAEEEKYIDEQTINMSREEKGIWIEDYRYNEMIRLEDEVYSYWKTAFSYIEKQDKEDKERLVRWYANQKK
jgi:hypothetical protein